MSFLQPQQLQPPPQQQEQQPVMVYPNNVRKQPSSSHHSDGSFGTVFIVLAVIIVISAIACFLGRLCNRRVQKAKPNKHATHNHNFRPNKEAAGAGEHSNHVEFGNNPNIIRAKEAAIEFGFDNKIPNGGKSNGNGIGNGVRSERRGYMNFSKPNNVNGDHHHPHHMKGEMKQHGDHVGFVEPRSRG